MMGQTPHESCQPPPGGRLVCFLSLSARRGCTLRWPLTHETSLRNWTGFASVGWLLAVYAFLFLVVARYDWHFEPAWLFMATVLVGWLGVGLLFGLAGLRRGGAIGRVAASIGIALFIFFSWVYWLSPVFIPAHSR